MTTYEFYRDEYGGTAGIVTMVYLYVIILIPVLMSFGKNAKPEPEMVKSAGATKADILFEFFGRKVCRHSIVIAVFSAAAMLLPPISIPIIIF